jgi:hypothetical protein
MLFSDLYKAQELPIYGNNGQERFRRRMRAYLVKDEGTLETLAK